MQRYHILPGVLLAYLLGLSSHPVAAGNRDVVIDEVLANPVSESTGEFVELFNGGATPVDIAGWSLTDAGDRNDVIADYTGDHDRGRSGTVIPPGGYALIVDPDYAGAYDDYLLRYADPASLVMVTISGDRTLGNGLGNGADAVMLDDGAGRMSRFAWTTDAGGNGVSWEKIRPGGGNDPSNWSPSRASFGSTPGVRNSVTPAPHDAGIAPEDITFLPASPSVNTDVTITARVRNVGFSTLASFEAVFFLDADNDSIPDAPEEIGTVHVDDPLSPGDSASVSTRWSPGRPGRRVIGVQVIAADDERSANDVALKEVDVAFPPRTLVVSEIMYAPRPGDPEWVELRNMTEHPVDLAGWTIEDADSTAARRIVTRRYAIEPSGYAIVTSDSSDFTATFPGVDVPVFRPSGGLPVLNNTGDTVTLRDPAGRIIDRVPYIRAWGGGNGASLERRLPEGASEDGLNWGTNRSATGSTPGRENSLTPPPFDVGLRETDVRIHPPQPGPGERATLTITVRNTGRQPVSDVYVEVAERRGTPSDSALTIIGRRVVPRTVLPGDSAVVMIQGAFPSGLHRLFVGLTHPSDGDSTNNRVAFTFPVRYASRALVINEIMFDPGDSGVEWIELFNRSAASIDLAGWTVETADSTRPRRIRESSLALPSQGYAVLVSDTVEFRAVFDAVSSIVLRPLGGWPALRNEGSPLVIRDRTGASIDRVDYLPAWSRDPGRSAERINPDRPSDEGMLWAASASVSGGTPGERNSLFATRIPARLTAEIAPNPFSPDGDGRDDAVTITLELPVTHAVVRLLIYDILGRRRKTLLDQAPTGSRRIVVWDGRDDRGRRVRIGPYILYIEMVQPETGRARSLKRVIVLARQL